MERMQELIPFAKEVLSHKPSQGLLKVYLLGSLFAVLGTIIGLVETVCHPFSSGEPLDAEMDLMLDRQQRTVEAELQDNVEDEEQPAHECGVATQSLKPHKAHRLNQRSTANRLHAS